MTLDDLNTEVANATQMSKAEAAKATAAFVKGIQGALKKPGDKVTITGFGVFEVTERAERDGRNPQTGEAIKIAASKAVKFKAGKSFRDAVNV